VKSDGVRQEGLRLRDEEDRKEGGNEENGEEEVITKERRRGHQLPPAFFSLSRTRT
jgi:hypothetical protein